MFKIEIELRAKFTFDDIKKIAEPRFCYKFMNNPEKANNSEVKNEEVEEE